MGELARKEIKAMMASKAKLDLVVSTVKLDRKEPKGHLVLAFPAKLVPEEALVLKESKALEVLSASLDVTDCLVQPVKTAKVAKKAKTESLAPLVSSVRLARMANWEMPVTTSKVNSRFT